MDTLGLVRAVVVHAASVQGRDGAKLVLAKLVEHCPRRQRLWADGSYAGKRVARVQQPCGWGREIVTRSDDATGFQVLPKRWIVERTCAWLGRYRRLSKDYEATTESGEAWVTIAMIHRMVRRLAPH